MKEKLHVLEEALRELFDEASTALAALRQIADACPSIICLSEFERAEGNRWCNFCYPKRVKRRNEWVTHYPTLAEFALDAQGNVVSYKWGDNVTNPGGLLAAMIRRERERLASVIKLADVATEEEED